MLLCIQNFFLSKLKHSFLAKCHPQQIKVTARHCILLRAIFKQRGLFNLLCRRIHDSNVIPYPDNLLSRHRMRLDLEQIFIWTLLFCSHISKHNEARVIINSPSRLHNPVTRQYFYLVSFNEIVSSYNLISELAEGLKIL